MDVRSHFAAQNRAALDTLHEAVQLGDRTAFRQGFEALHVFAHDDAEVHEALHRLELEVARRDGDVRGVLKSLAPVAFAGLVSALEAAGPDYVETVYVDAPRAHVFRTLTDFEGYSAWNPWLTAARGEARVGAGVQATVRLGDAARAVDHVVEVVQPDVRFAWRDAGWFTPLARGRRLRSLSDEGEGTRLCVRLTVTGPFAALVHRLHGKALGEGLRQETEALAAHCARTAQGVRRTDDTVGGAA